MAASRVFVVTGANTGIGRATAHALARQGGRVILACRSREKTEPILEEIRAATHNEAVEFLELDLARFESVRRAAAELTGRGHPIHVLVNNAGLAGQRGVTADGFELAFGTNHLGHFLFTTLLLDRIRESAPARIVTVASHSHYRATGFDWGAIRSPTQSLAGIREYEVSKLANVLFSAELGRRLAGAGVSTYALHPGVIASDIWRRIPWPLRSLATVFMKSNEDGAKTTLHCALGDVAEQSGLYWADCAPRKPSRQARDEALAAELWRRSEELVQA
jgi:retinol dehydrogenase-12